MSNLDSEEHVSIDRYGSEEIIDINIIDHKRPTQDRWIQKEFSLLHYIEMKVVMAKKMLQVLDEEYRLRKASFNISIWE